MKKYIYTLKELQLMGKDELINIIRDYIQIYKQDKIFGLKYERGRINTLRFLRREFK